MLHDIIMSVINFASSGETSVSIKVKPLVGKLVFFPPTLREKDSGGGSISVLIMEPNETTASTVTDSSQQQQAAEKPLTAETPRTSVWESFKDDRNLRVRRCVLEVAAATAAA